MSKKQKFYVVWKGKRPGIYDKWEDCKAAISGYKGAKYKSFSSFSEAKKAYDAGFSDYIGKKDAFAKASASKGKFKSNLSADELYLIGQPNFHSISVDAASSGNPGKMEYQGVDTKTKKKLFKMGPFPQGTNNIGEFLALVHGLALLKQKGSDRSIYSDSQIAIGWVRKKKCGTKMQRNAKNEELFTLIARAETWLKKNDYSTPIVKWETKAWGEIPADFGRK